MDLSAFILKGTTGCLVDLARVCQGQEGGYEQRAAEDVDPAAGTSSGRDACVQAAAPRPVAPLPRPSAPMKPPRMKLRAARVRRKVAGDREHALARRVLLDGVVCG